MNRWSPWALVALLTAAPVVATAASSVQETSVPQLEPAWNRSYRALDQSQWPPLSVALSESGGCAAIAAAGALEVVDRRGELLWRWDYLRTNRFISPGAVAVSADCDAVALLGHPGYRYTWIVDKAGAKAVVRTANTPLGAAFDRRGKLIAVGTGGGEVLLLTRSGATKWKAEVRFGICRELSFAPDNEAIVLHSWGQVGVLTLDGREVWSATASEMRAAGDLRTFVTWERPGHGPGIGTTAVLNAAGKEQWRRFTSWTGAVVSPTGDTIVAQVNENQDPKEEDYWGVAQASSLQVLSRDGALVRRLDGLDAVPIAMSPDGRRVLLNLWQDRPGLEEIDLDGNRIGTIPLSGGSPVVARDFSAVVVVVPTDGQNDVRWYALK